MKERRSYPLQVWSTKLERTINKEIHVSRVACICVVPRRYQRPRESIVTFACVYNTTADDTTRRRPESLYERQYEDTTRRRPEKCTQTIRQPNQYSSITTGKRLHLEENFFSETTNPKGGTPGRGVLLFRGCGTSPR